MRYMFCGVSVLLVLLFGCAKPMAPSSDLLGTSKHFSQAMRWRDYIGAGRHLRENVRNELFAIFQDDEDLRIVDSVIFSIDLADDGKSAKVDYRMQYYRLPSLRVKKWQWLQEWHLERNKIMKSDLWLISNSPPPAP